MQDQSHYETDLNDEMKLGWTFAPKADHKVMWSIRYKSKERNGIEMKSTKLYHQKIAKIDLSK